MNRLIAISRLGAMDRGFYLVEHFWVWMLVACVVALTFGCTGGAGQPTITIACAAVMRSPIEEIVAAYQTEKNVVVETRFGGSNTLLSELQIARVGDVFIAADSSYTDQTHQLGLSGPGQPLAMVTPVILVREDGPASLQVIEDLANGDYRVAMANPQTAAIGRNTEKVLESMGLWESIQQNVQARGVLLLNVNAVANAVALGSVDAGIVWDATAKLHRDLRVIRDERWRAGRGTVEIAVLTDCQNRFVVEDFVEYATSDPVCREILKSHGLQPLE